MAVYAWKDTQPKPTASQQITGAQPSPQPTTNQTQGQTGATAATPFSKTSFQAPAFKPVSQPQVQGQSFSSMLQGAQPQRQQAVQGAYQSASDMLKPQEGPSQQSELSRAAFLKAQQEAARQAGEASALSGRLQTGQSVGDRNQFNQGALSQRMDLEANLSAVDQQAAQQRQAQGISSILGLEGLAQQERSTDASLSLQAELGRGDLTLREKQLTQQGTQFKDELSFKEWAVKQGASEAEAARAWQSMENEKGRTSQEKVAFAGLDLERDKFTAADANAKAGLDLQASALKLEELGMAKEDAYRYASLAQTKTLAERGLSLDEMRVELEEKGLNQQDAQYYAGLAADERLQGLQQKWATGERLGAQEFNLLVEGNRQKFEATQNDLNRTLQLDTIDKQQAFAQLMETQRQTYETLRQKNGFSHEQAMAQLQGNISSALQQQGFNQQATLQAAQIAASMVTQARQIESQEKMQAAEMALKNDWFREELGIKKEDLALRTTQVMADIENSAAMLGLQKNQMEAVLKSTEAQNAIQLASMLSSMSDEPDQQEFAAQVLFDGLGKAGLLTPDQVAAGKLSQKQEGFQDAADFITWAKGEGYTGQQIAARLDAAGYDGSKYVQPDGSFGDASAFKGMPAMGGGQTTGGAATVKVTPNTSTGQVNIQINGKDMTSATKDDWSQVAQQPAQIDALEEAGKLVKVGTFPAMKRTADFTQWLDKGGFKYTKNGDNITFAKGQEPIVQADGGKLYRLTSFNTSKVNDGPFDEYRHSLVNATDLTTDKPVTLSDQYFDI